MSTPGLPEFGGAPGSGPGAHGASGGYGAPPPPGSLPPAAAVPPSGSGPVGPSPQGTQGPPPDRRAGLCLIGACAALLVGTIGLGAVGVGVWTVLREQETVTSTRPPASPESEEPEQPTAAVETTEPPPTTTPPPTTEVPTTLTPTTEEPTATAPTGTGAATVELVVSDVHEVDMIETGAGTQILPENGVLITVDVDMTNHGDTVIQPDIDAVTVRDADGNLIPVRVLSFTTDSAGFAPGATVTLEVTVDVPAGTQIVEVGYTDPVLTGGQELIAPVP